MERGTSNFIFEVSTAGIAYFNKHTTTAEKDNEWSCYCLSADTHTRTYTHVHITSKTSKNTQTLERVYCQPPTHFSFISSLSCAHSHILTLVCTLTYTYTRTHSHTRTDTHARTLFFCNKSMAAKVSVTAVAVKIDRTNELIFAANHRPFVFVRLRSQRNVSKKKNPSTQMFC